jgi:hypothetical protein
MRLHQPEHHQQEGHCQSHPENYAFGITATVESSRGFRVLIYISDFFNCTLFRNIVSACLIMCDVVM